LSSPRISRLLFPSPIGTLVLEAKGEILTKIALAGPEAASEPGGSKSPGEKGAAQVLLNFAGQLEEYFAGKRDKFSIPSTVTCTRLERYVWSRLTEVPYGQTITCSKMASLVRKARSFWDYDLVFDNVVKAVANCPLLILVPAHRLVNDEGEAVLPENPVYDQLRKVEEMATNIGPSDSHFDPVVPGNFSVPVRPADDSFTTTPLNLHVNGRFLVPPPTGDPNEREGLYEEIRQAILNGNFKLTSGDNQEEVNAFDAAVAQRFLSSPAMAEKLINNIKKTLGRMDREFFLQKMESDDDDDDPLGLYDDDDDDDDDDDEGYYDDEDDDLSFGSALKGPFNAAVLSVLPNEDIAELIASTIKSDIPEAVLVKALTEVLNDGIPAQELAVLMSYRHNLNLTDITLARHILKHRNEKEEDGSKADIESAKEALAKAHEASQIETKLETKGKQAKSKPQAKVKPEAKTEPEAKGKQAKSKQAKSKPQAKIEPQAKSKPEK
jgi:methylated-DNA-[protein]-cysteine S-methyltransferase